MTQLMTDSQMESGQDFNSLSEQKKYSKGTGRKAFQPIKKCLECDMTETWLSWSRLRSHEECKQKSYLARQRNKEPMLSDHRNFLPGNITDRVVRNWLLDDPWNNLGRMPEMVAAQLDEEVLNAKTQDGYVGWKSAEDKGNIIEKCTLAVKNIEPALVKYVIPFEYTPDYKFQNSLDIEIPGQEDTMTVVLNGYMDILVKHSEGRYFIFDVKHTEDNSYWKKTVGQLTFYDIAVFLGTGHYSSASALFQPLCKEPIHMHAIAEEQRQKMWQSITNYAIDVAKNNSQPTENTKQCYGCRYKHACVMFKPKMSNGKKVLSL